MYGTTENMWNKVGAGWEKVKERGNEKGEVERINYGKGKVRRRGKTKRVEDN